MRIWFPEAGHLRLWNLRAERPRLARATRIRKEKGMRMFRHGSTIGLVAATITLTATVAFAANVHLKRKPPLSFTDNTPSELTLTADGALTGLGNGDVCVTLTAVAQPTSTCTNPGNGVHQPPGQNPASVTLSGSEGIPAGDIKNGNVSFTVETAPPTTPIAGAPDCPNSSWTEDITDLTFTSTIITVGQPAMLNPDGSCLVQGPIVFTVSCSLTGADGTLTATCP